MQRIAVLASGGGSNLQAIIDHLDALGADAPATVALVVSDRADAYALERARSRGIATLHLPRNAPEGALEQMLADQGTDVVALAGYLRLIPHGRAAMGRTHAERPSVPAADVRWARHVRPPRA